MSGSRIRLVDTPKDATPTETEPNDKGRRDKGLQNMRPKEMGPKDAKAAGFRAGAELREARERLGWDLGEVAAALRIKLAYLQAIEEGRIAALPGNAYALGFLRTYATTLGLDADEISRRFRSEANDVNRKTDLAFPAPVPERGVPTGALVLIGLVIAAAGYGAWYKLSDREQAPTHIVPAVPDELLPARRAAPVSPQVASVLPPPGTAVPTLPPPLGGCAARHGTRRPDGGWADRRACRVGPCHDRSRHAHSRRGRARSARCRNTRCGRARPDGAGCRRHRCRAGHPVCRRGRDRTDGHPAVACRGCRHRGARHGRYRACGTWHACGPGHACGTWRACGPGRRRACPPAGRGAARERRHLGPGPCRRPPCRVGPRDAARRHLARPRRHARPHPHHRQRWRRHVVRRRQDEPGARPQRLGPPQPVTRSAGGERPLDGTARRRARHAAAPRARARHAPATLPPAGSAADTADQLNARQLAH